MSEMYLSTCFRPHNSFELSFIINFTFHFIPLVDYVCANTVFCNCFYSVRL